MGESVNSRVLKINWLCFCFLLEKEKVSVLIQIAETEFHRMGGLNNKYLFLTVLQAWHPDTSTVEFLVKPSS